MQTTSYHNTCNFKYSDKFTNVLQFLSLGIWITEQTSTNQVKSSNYTFQWPTI